MTKRILFSLTLVFALLLVGSFSHEILAQCAMCKATVSSNATTGKVVSAGLNNGIYYLMAIPYLLFGTIAFFWYKNSKNAQKNPKLKLRISKISE